MSTSETENFWWSFRPRRARPAPKDAPEAVCRVRVPEALDAPLTDLHDASVGWTQPATIIVNETVRVALRQFRDDVCDALAPALAKLRARYPKQKARVVASPAKPDDGVVPTTADEPLPAAARETEYLDTWIPVADLERLVPSVESVLAAAVGFSDETLFAVCAARKLPRPLRALPKKAYPDPATDDE